MKFTTYLNTWDKNCLNTLNAIPVDSNTIVNLAFASFNFDEYGNIGGMTLTGEEIRGIIKTVRDKGGKINIAFGGATSPYFISNSNLWSDPVAMTAAIVKIVNGYGFDGCDFDIEEAGQSVEFTNKAIKIIKGVKDTASYIYVSLTIPAQGWNTYWQGLAIQGQPFVDCINFMEYDLWIGSDYVSQIKSDISDYYITNWKIQALKINLGLMPGLDDKSINLTLDMATNLSAWAKEQGLYGVMIWEANRDYAGVGGNSSNAYTNAIMKTIL